MTTKEKLMHLLEMCLEKGLNYQINYKFSLIEISQFKDDYERTFHVRAYFDCDECVEIGHLITFDNLITKVKNYQP